MLKPFHKRLLIAISVFALTAPFNATAQSSLQDFHEDASRLYHQNDYQGALIQLKNALQINPEHVPSLVLSAQVWIALNNPEAAEDSLIKAKVMGADPRFIDLKLAEVYRQQKKYQSIIDELSIRGLNSEEAVELLGYTAEAYLGLNQDDKAALAIEQAEAIIPGALRPNMAQIRLDIRQQSLEEAIQLGHMLIQRFPDSGEAWNLYASALHANGQLAPALENYSEALKVDPANLEARVARVGLLLDMQRANDTLSDLQHLEKEYPYEPRAAYFRGLTYSLLQSPDNDYAAQSLVQLKNCTEIIAQLPPESVRANQQLSMIAALAHYGLSEFEASKEYLSQYLGQHRYDLGANRLMGDTLIKLGDPLSASRYLKVAHARYPDDKKTITLLAQAYSQTGHPEQAQALLKKLNQTNTANNTPDSEVDTRLALSMMQTRHFDDGIQQLKAIYDHDKTQYQAGFSLVLALLKNDQNTAALSYAQQLAKHSPDNISAQNLLGVTQQAAGELDAAKTTFQHILQTAPDTVPTQINLAKIEYAQGNTQIAREQFEKLLKEHPGNEQTMLGLARYYVDEGQLDDALKLSENAYQLHKNSIDTRRLLIQIYLKQQKYDAAEALALDTVNFSDNPFESQFDANMMLGQVYQQIGKPRKAVSLYKTMTKDAGFHSDSLHQIALQLIQLQSWEAARHALYKSIEGNPDHLASRLDYIRVQLVIGDFQDAYERSQTVITQYPDNTTGYLLAGDSLTQLQKFSEAQAIYQQGLTQNFDSRLVLNQTRLLNLQGKDSEAAELLANFWTQTSDSSIGSAYSLHLINVKQWQEAQAILKILLSTQTSNPSLLNNMAYVSDKLGQAQALDYAREAYRHAPENPFINDTLGWLLVKSGKTEDGLKYLRQAVVRLTDNPELRYHLGKALSDLGRKVEAKRELEQALNHEGNFEGKHEALNLLQTLLKTNVTTAETS
ncbi:XrtA/PEP-CTERM system TPR-repeat protein PrsT [Pseudomaricurvus sp.]|uniref:XrtA/PEP-CTERM system TPR-repeat protein PrsT n=1 Tax=Pseudomaricurvus sp. TaxID=2004510 RepID=UPI003F6A580A